jgi:hypothetical protein
MSAEIFGPDIFIVLLIPLVGIAAAIDALAKPSRDFERAGQSKTLWVLLPLLGIFLFGIVAIVAAVLWFASIRPKVVEANKVTT